MAADLETRLDRALSRGRWIVEGEWTGYTSSQTRAVHRKVITAKQAAAIKAIGFIRYTDGTGLRLFVRPCKPRERVSEIDGYTSLINDCVRAGHGEVARLVADKKAAQEARNAQRHAEIKAANLPSIDDCVCCDRPDAEFRCTACKKAGCERGQPCKAGS